MANEDTIRFLEAELVRLKAQERDIARLREKIREVLELTKSLSETGAVATNRRASASHDSENDISAMGLRKAIRLVLADSKRALKPKEVASELERRGFSLGDARTPLLTRVQNDLFKMNQEDQLDRTESGRYKLKE